MLSSKNGGLPSSVTASNGSVKTAMSGLQPLDPESLRMRLQALEASRLDLAHRQKAAQDFTENPPGLYRLFAPAVPQGVVRQGRRFKVASLSVFFGLIGAVGAAGLLMFFELTDRRIKNTADIRRITRLPLLATLGDLRQMSQTAETDWAFRTWTLLQGRLSHSPNRGLVCGIISSCQGEGRSTWVKLLAKAASQLGFRVLTIATQPSPTDGDAAKNSAEGTAEDRFEPDKALALARSVLSSPLQVTQKLVGQEREPHVHIPLPGWVWDLGRRQQWQGALNHWRKIDNIVILIELPPASVPEGVLLAQNLPNLVWLAGSGRADAADTRDQLATLRHARCHLVGAVLNRAPDPLLKNRFSRWVGCLTLSLALSSSTGKAADGDLAVPSAEAAPTAAAETNLVLAGSTDTNRSVWQQRLTLGPGDILTFSLFGSPELTRKNVSIGPDGRVGYLEAQNILASGLTVDELRAKLDAGLADYRRAARTMVTPEAFRSKKIFVLGTVVHKGVFTLDRPMTIIEAVAQGRGLETGLFDHGTRELADLQHSFLARQGKRVPVDLEKLFQGDLSQNVPLEPDDYLFFPPTSHAEVYVLGEVRIPGMVGFSGDLTAIGAITERGGFSERAWKKKVLIVRGSLNRPEKFVVDTAAVLSASVPDLRLEPKDIVYVSQRPWIKAEELLDAAASAFVQSAVIFWTGQNIK
jgi:protein involved in polysaccharide export with SLBB domain